MGKTKKSKKRPTVVGFTAEELWLIMGLAAWTEIDEEETDEDIVKLHRKLRSVFKVKKKRFYLRKGYEIEFTDGD